MQYLTKDQDVLAIGRSCNPSNISQILEDKGTGRKGFRLGCTDIMHNRSNTPIF